MQEREKERSQRRSSWTVLECDSDVAIKPR